MIDDSAPPDNDSPPPPILETARELAKDANSALNGMADAVGLTDQVEKAPYAMIGAALGVARFTASTLLERAGRP